MGREIHDPDLLLAAQIVDLTNRVIGVHERNHGAHSVAHVSEASTLLAIAVHRQGLVVQRLFNEAGHYHPVMTALPRANRIEAPPNESRAMAFAPIRDGQELINGL